ncbi:MAG TPA: hypothetical protein VH325_07210 [Bryobacteraceae bacterium]|nr:hypothetical protein [Bryobacteraceae bacterium]
MSAFACSVNWLDGSVCIKTCAQLMDARDDYHRGLRRCLGGLHPLEFRRVLRPCFRRSRDFTLKSGFNFRAGELHGDL